MSNKNENTDMNQDTSIVLKEGEDHDMEEVVEKLPEVVAAKQVEEESTSSSTPPIPPPTATITLPSNDAANNTFKSTSVALIEKLLAFSTPRLDVKIVNVLFLEGELT